MLIQILTWKAHWEGAEWILRYLQGTREECLYFGNGEIKVHNYNDIDYGGEVNNHKSTTSYIFIVGIIVAHCMLKLKKIFALITIEVE